MKAFWEWTRNALKGVFTMKKPVEQGVRDVLKFLFVSGILSFGLLLLTVFEFDSQFSAFGIGLVMAIIALSIVWSFDRFAVREVDTMTLLKQDPKAYAIFLFGVFYLVATCISAAVSAH